MRFTYHLTGRPGRSGRKRKNDFFPIFPAFLFVFCLACPACSRNGTTNTTSAPAAAWNWAQYPLSSELLIAQLPATVVPVRAQPVRAPVAGILRLLPAARSESALAAGVAWAAIEPDTAPDEAADLTRARQELSERRTRYAGFDREADLEKLDAEIAAGRETAALARFAEHSSDLFTGDSPILDPHLRPTSSSAQAETRLKALEDRRRQVAAGDAAVEPGDIQAMAQSIDERQRALDEKLARRLLAAPIAGRLRLAVSPDADGTRVEAGALLATIQDDSALEVVIRADLPLLHTAPENSLVCRIAASGGAETTAVFSSWGVAAAGDGTVPVIRFRLPAGAFAPDRGSIAGVELPALVFVRLPAPARIVPKLDLVSWDSAGALAAGWRAGVAKLFPSAKVVAEGRAAVAIEPEGAEKTLSIVFRTSESGKQEGTGK